MRGDVEERESKRALSGGDQGAPKRRGKGNVDEGSGGEGEQKGRLLHAGGGERMVSCAAKCEKGIVRCEAR